MQKISNGHFTENELFELVWYSFMLICLINITFYYHYFASHVGGLLVATGVSSFVFTQNEANSNINIKY